MSLAIPKEIQEHLFEQLKINSSGFSRVSGGCINNGGRLQTSSGDFFIKWNDAKKFPGMLKAEALGLRLLRQTNCVHVPLVVSTGEAGGIQFILMEWIEANQEKKNYWEELGRRLAALHQNTSPAFGLEHDNYVGSLPQSNQQAGSWVDFFIHERLQPQLNLLGKDRSMIQPFEKLYQKLPELLPEESPAFLHGDLWSGNLLTDTSGLPCLIDPAVYYGHREAELAFTRLFGGFSEEFYSAYEEILPLQAGFEDRIDIYNLYPLLVHSNLFGGSYLQQVKRIISHWA